MKRPIVLSHREASILLSNIDQVEVRELVSSDELETLMDCLEGLTDDDLAACILVRRRPPGRRGS